MMIMSELFTVAIVSVSAWASDVLANSAAANAVPTRSMDMS